VRVLALPPVPVPVPSTRLPRWLADQHLSKVRTPASDRRFRGWPVLRQPGSVTRRRTRKLPQAPSSANSPESSAAQ
jgi:hypothetical protein